MFGIRSFRLATAPGKALTLDMDQTALDRDLRPEPAKHLQQMGIPIDRGAPGGQAPFLQVAAKPQEVSGALRNIVGSHQKLMALGIHHRKDASAPIQVGAVEQHMANGSQALLLLWRMFQPVVQDATDRRGTMTALLGQLLDRIALLNPSPKPNAFPDIPVRRNPPTVRAATMATEPTLFLTPVSPIALNFL